MAKVEIYTTKTCPYCMRAKNLLEKKGVTLYKEIDVSENHDLRVQMMERAGGRKTVPQIFIKDQHIGGFDDMNALDLKGELDALLR